MPTESVALLVIDASVIFMAGGIFARDEFSIICREFLNEVRLKQYRIVVSEELQDEIIKYGGKFPLAVKWLVQMRSIGKSKVLSIKLDDFVELWQEIEGCIVGQRELVAKKLQRMGEDFHLVRAALQTERTIISADREVRDFFTEACLNVNQIRELFWFDIREDAIVRWARGGGLVSTARHLCNP